MTEKSFIWDTVTGDGNTISEADSAEFFKALMGADGVYIGYLNSLEPEVSGSTVRVKTGWGIVQGHPYRNDALLTKTPTTPSVGTTGHRLVLRADLTAQTVRVVDIASADGTAAIPAEATNDVTLGYFTITTGGVVALTDARERARPIDTVSDIFQNFVEANVNRGFFAMGPPTNQTYLPDVPFGLGWVFKRNNVGASVGIPSSYNPGMWLLNTGATITVYASLHGPQILPAMDPTLVARIKIASSAAQTAFWGFKQQLNPADEAELIGFRLLNTGNVVGVCSTAAGETTRDSGANGATEALYRVEIRNGGALVRFFKNGVKIGDDVTTNISTGVYMMACVGVQTDDSSNKTLYATDVFGWMEN